MQVLPPKQKRQPRGGRSSRIVALLAVIGLLAALWMVSQIGILDLPDWFDGGESDDAPGGQVTYEGQTARSASEEFLIDIGDGEAVVSVQARQRWDTPGNVFSGDFVSDNGTSSVRDPEDHDLPARLVVAMDYCAAGEITVTEPEDPDAEGARRTVRFEMGEIYVCDATLEHTPENDASFGQDDTPADFHGRFVSFVAGAAETTAIAAECPRDELQNFRDNDYTSYVREQLSGRFDVPPEAVDVVPGRIGSSSSETQDELRDALDSYANMRDPDDPDTTYDALDIQYLSGDGEAVADSCYLDPGSTDLDELGDVTAPQVEDR